MNEKYRAYWKKMENQIGEGSALNTISWFALIPGALCFLKAAVDFEEGNNFFGSGVLGIGLLVVYFFLLKNAQKNRGEVSGTYKMEIVQPYFEERINDVTLSLGFGISKSQLQEIDILQNGTVYSDTRMEGTYHGIEFSQSNLKIEQSDEDSNTIVFWGAFYTLHLPNKINTSLTIATKKFKAAKNKTGMFVSAANKFYKLEGYGMDFDVTGADEKIGRELLEQNPWLLSEIKELQDIAGVRLLVHISYNRMYAAIAYGRDILDADYGDQMQFIDSIRYLEKNMKVIEKLTEIAAKL